MRLDSMSDAVEISDYPRFLCLGLSNRERQAINFLSKLLMEQGNNSIRITELDLHTLSEIARFVDVISLPVE